MAMARLEALAKYVSSLQATETSHIEVNHSVQLPKEKVSPITPHTQTKLSVRSAGFRAGNFSEVWFGNKLYLPRSISRRGLTLLVLSQDLSTFHLWQFDFYPFVNARKINENLVCLLERIPAKTYFALTVKDDIVRNLDFTTRQFLSSTIGSQYILRLQFRDSWAIVVYKPTLSSFRVLGEDHKSSGLARVDVQVPIHTTDTSSEFIEKEDAIKKLNIEEETELGLHSVKKDISDQITLLQELQTESETLKKQLTAQLEIIRSIKDLVIKNEEAVIALADELNK